MKPRQEFNLEKNLCLITGAARGLGLELCRAMKTQGYPVVATCRNTSRQLEALDVEVVERVDVSKASASRLIARVLRKRTVGSIICNAGMILRAPGMRSLNPTDIRRHFETNTLGAVHTVLGALPNVGHGGRIMMITSIMGSLDENPDGGDYGYRMSKVALNMLAKTLRVDLAPRSVVVDLVHPGWIRSRMGGRGGKYSIADSAERIVKRLCDGKMERKGLPWHIMEERSIKW